MKKISALFNVHHLYYLPQFLPVAREMEERGNFDIYFSAYTDKKCADYQLIKDAVKNYSGKFIDAADEKERRKEILAQQFDIIVFGKSGHAEQYCSSDTLAILLYHGIGVKACYYTDFNPRINIRYVEGRYRYEELKRRGVSTELVVTGFPKLDPLFDSDNPEHRDDDLILDPSKPTILYAPTFYPSSIEIFGKSIAELTRGYNLIVKLHHFSWILDKYRHQKLLFMDLAEKYSHVQLLIPEKYNIIPYFKCADILLTEASSTAFEFLAAGRPVIICDFHHLRIKHRIFNRCFRKSRMDNEIQQYLGFAYHVNTPAQLPEVLERAMEEKDVFSKRASEISEEFLGVLDGNASKRIVDDILKRF